MSANDCDVTLWTTQRIFSGCYTLLDLSRRKTGIWSLRSHQHHKTSLVLSRESKRNGACAATPWTTMIGRHGWESSVTCAELFTPSRCQRTNLIGFFVLYNYFRFLSISRILYKLCQVFCLYNGFSTSMSGFY